MPFLLDQAEALQEACARVLIAGGEVRVHLEGAKSDWQKICAIN